MGTGTRQPIFSIKQQQSAATWVSRTISVERSLLRGGVAYAQGDLDRAVMLEEEAAALFRQIGALRWIGMTEWFLGMFAASQRRFPEAARHYRESFRTLIDATDVVWLFKPLAGLAAVAVENGDVESAARLLGAVDADASQHAVATSTHCTGLSTSRPTPPLVRPWARSGSPPSMTPVDA